MDEIIKSLASDELEEIAELLYGDAAYEVVKSLTPQQKKQRRDKILQNTAIATNTIGGVAGPAAIGLAYRARKTGGMPREGAKTFAPKMAQSKRPRVAAAGRKMGRIANKLDNPSGRGAKIAAGAAGAGLIGMQTVNWGGDMLSAKLINDQKKKDNAVKKSDTREHRRIKLIRLGTEAAFDSARVAPMVAARAKKQSKSKVRKSDTTMDILWQGEIAKADEDKRQVFGWASIVEMDGKPVLDLQGDVMTVDEIEKSAYEYVKTSRKGGNQHQKTDDGPLHVSDLIESFLVTDDKKEVLGLPADTPTGWWVGFQVNDDKTWQDYKAGKLPGFSIHGSGVRKAIELED